MYLFLGSLSVISDSSLDSIVNELQKTCEVKQRNEKRNSAKKTQNQVRWHFNIYLFNLILKQLKSNLYGMKQRASNCFIIHTFFI